MARRSRRVVWSARARHGLDGVLEYIAEDSPSAAEKVLDVVLRAAHSLSELSERGRVVPELRNPHIREVFVYSYRLIYEITNADVSVLAFLHGAQDFNRWLKNTEGL